MAIFCNNCGKENLDIDTHCSSCGEELDIDDSLPEGVILQKRYKIEELLKTGGMGSVYKGLDQRLNRHIAIKELLLTYNNTEEKEYAEKRFQEEAYLLSQLENYHLPTIHDYFIENGRYYLVLSYIEGVDLAQLLEIEGKPGLPEHLVIEWALQILDVLDYLHTREPPIVYRDIKPGNIMIHKDGRIILVDFGIARTIQTDKEVLYTAIGTDGYAPEEQYRGVVTPASDIYSLGVTMHHLLTGEHPVPFNLKPVRNIAPWVSSELESIVMKAVEFEEKKRYEQARDMKSALLNKENLLPVPSPIAKKSKTREPHGRKPVSYNEIKDILNLDPQGFKPLDSSVKISPSLKSSSLSDVLIKKLPEERKDAFHGKFGKDISGFKQVIVQEKKKHQEHMDGEAGRKKETLPEMPEIPDRIKRIRSNLSQAKTEVEEQRNRVTNILSDAKMPEYMLEMPVGEALDNLLQGKSFQEDDHIPKFLKLTDVKPEDRTYIKDFGLKKKER